MAGLFGSLSRGLEGKSGSLLDLLDLAVGGRVVKSGQTVNWKTALEATTVLACCRVLCNGVAQVPWKVYRSRAPAAGKDEARDHPLFNLLWRKPNSFQTSFEFRRTMVLHMALAGDFIAFKNVVGGQVRELIPLEPARVTVRQQRDLSLVYEVTGADGGMKPLPASMVWHVRGLSWNGWQGLEPVKLAREAIGLSLALEEAHARLHQNGAQPSGIYSIDGVLGPEQYEKLTKWIAKHAAAENRGSPLILDQGAKWLSQQMTGVDAQHVETRRLQIEEVCRAMGVMPIMIGQADKVATYASAEQMFLAHVIHTLDPLYVAIEQSADVQLVGEADQGTIFTEFSRQGLMRGDFKGRQEGLQIMRRNGVINADDWRDLEGLNPREDGGGSEFIVEANMAPQGADANPVRDPSQGGGNA